MDTLLITEEKDYKLIGFNTLFQKKEKISDKTRIILLCRENGSSKNKFKIRNDLNNSNFPSIWLEVTNDLDYNVLE